MFPSLQFSTTSALIYLQPKYRLNDCSCSTMITTFKSESSLSPVLYTSSLNYNSIITILLVKRVRDHSNYIYLFIILILLILSPIYHVYNCMFSKFDFFLKYASVRKVWCQLKWVTVGFFSPILRYPYVSIAFLTTTTRDT